jgi:hypothetical protein
MKSENILCIPRIFSYIPLISTIKACVVFGLPYIFIRYDLHAKYMSAEIDPQVEAYIAHESTHLKRQPKGLARGIWWGIQYWLQPHMRLTEELAAIESEMEVLHRHALVFDVDQRARALSSVYYGWCTCYTTATKKLTQLWLAQN